MIKRWWYKIIEPAEFIDIDKLNDLGCIGWELVSCVYHPDGLWHYVLKQEWALREV